MISSYADKSSLIRGSLGFNISLSLRMAFFLSSITLGSYSTFLALDLFELLQLTNIFTGNVLYFPTAQLIESWSNLFSTTLTKIVFFSGINFLS